MKLASEILNMEVLSLGEGSVLGRVRNIIIDPSSGKFVALMLYGKGIKKDKCLISSLEIKQLDGENIIVESLDTIETKEDLPRPYEILKNKIFVIGSKVFNESDIFLGKVFDLALDTNIDQMTRVYVARTGLMRFFGSNLIISYLQIIEIKKGRIIVSSTNLESSAEISIDTAS